MTKVHGHITQLGISGSISQMRVRGSIVKSGYVFAFAPAEAPTLLTATTVSDTQIDLGWTINSTRQIGHAIERTSVAGGGSGWGQIDIVLGAIDVYSDKSCEPVTKYYYRVRAYRYDIYSDYSNVDSDTTLSSFDFLWIEGENNITATELIDISGNGNNVTITGKDFATDYIPATSAAIFDCPDNATFIADDSDNLWINKNEESRGVEVSEMIGYDFARTIVWYDDNSPHHIRAIGILKSTITLTEAQINKLHTDFRLALFWSGVENVNGFIKANRGLAQNVWTAVSVAALDYSDTYQTAVLADGGTIIKRKVVESEYQRLINTGNILTCWFSYHYQAGIKITVVDYGLGNVNMVAKWYNLSPVAGRFAQSVVPYYIIPPNDARPEYTSSGVRFRTTNLDGGSRCGLDTTATAVIPNNNNKIRIRGIINPTLTSVYDCVSV